MGSDNRPKLGFQQNKTRINNTTLFGTLQWKQENFVITDACKTGLGVALWQQKGNEELKSIAFASRYLNDAEKNIPSAN